ncbi:phage terminase small subunit P27 family [Roseibaca sp. V10]|uniref:Phage terminase small subunit P27 family n=1 Tax=Roseinatronobacter domitianus TaxID=2940293 RepID=A0ABT0M6V4_9RHOB|nr:phage terminase small subunit P27 family [Roseibaca domitiana]MCL1630130.1 phage terminase small subunit P27 family [Roseibaca domitiana]
MTRGPKPKPTALKVIRGTDRAARRNPSEPRVAPARPDPPDHLSSEARTEWQRVTDQLCAAGIVTGIDRAALAAYCQAYGRWEQAERALEAMAARDQVTAGLMIRTQGGNAIQNPLVGTANKAMADMMRYAAEFGMTPSARTQIHAEVSASDPDDPVAKYFGG